LPPAIIDLPSCGRTERLRGGVLLHELPHEVGDAVIVLLKGEVPGVDRSSRPRLAA
jgi:hypothetical protein